MNRPMKKKEALTVTRFISEVLVSQLSIPLKQIVNDTTFTSYIGSKRPDLLISEFEYDPTKENDAEFIENLVAYAEAKDDCSVNDADWNDAIKQGKKKAPKLKLPYFIVTNCKTTIFYNVMTGEEIMLNNKPIREFQTIDILRLIKNNLNKKPHMENILTNVDSLAVISEATFNRKLWELDTIYRPISFDNNVQKIDFTIGFIALEFFEEKEEINHTNDKSKIYWSNCSDGTETYSAEKIVASLSQYIERLVKESQFSEFVDFMENVQVAIRGKGTEKPKVSKEEVKQIYNLINSMKPLHGAGFDLFGAVYEKFASSKEKKEFGQYFTRRYYTHIFAKLLLKNEQYFDKDKKFRVLDLACGTGGFLTECFKVLKSNYVKNDSYDGDAEKFLETDCFWGYDAIKDNIARTKLNMFLVGDGHTHMTAENTLTKDFGNEKWDYIITNPPYGLGTIPSESETQSSKRTEIAFLFRIIKLLKNGKKACVILPDGVLENLSFSKIRKEFLERCDIDAIVSLPKFAFAPYTKEKTYAVYITKKNAKKPQIQKNSIWMYIVDNDGIANSDKRFPTRLRNNRNGWMHDEISGWVSTEGEEMAGKLEEAWLQYDDEKTGGTEWVDEKGKKINLRKGGFIEIAKIQELKSHYCLMPEYYLRSFQPNFITVTQLLQNIDKIKQELKNYEI